MCLVDGVYVHSLAGSVCKDVLRTDLRQELSEDLLLAMSQPAQEVKVSGDIAEGIQCSMVWRRCEGDLEWMRPR